MQLNQGTTCIIVLPFEVFNLGFRYEMTLHFAS